MKPALCNLTPRKRGLSASFWLTAVLLVCMLLYFYLPVFCGELPFGDYLYPLFFAAGFLAAAIALSARKLYTPLWLKLLFLASFLLAAISSALDGTDLTHAYGLLTVLVGLYCYRKDPLRRAERELLLPLFAVAVGLLLLNGVPGDPSLTLPAGKFNPNTCGFLLTVLYCVCFSRYLSERGLRRLALSILLFLLQLVYLSRTALLGSLFFTCAALVCRTWKRNSFTAPTVCGLLFCFSLLGVLAAFLYSEVLFPLIGNGKIVILGKDLFTGRQTIWNGAFKAIAEHPLFGVGNELNRDLYEQTGNVLMMNAHNQPLGTLAATGLPSFLVFYAAFSAVGAAPYAGAYGERAGRAPALFLVTVTVMSFFDIYFFSPYNFYAILIAYGLLFARKEA